MNSNKESNTVSSKIIKFDYRTMEVNKTIESETESFVVRETIKNREIKRNIDRILKKS